MNIKLETLAEVARPERFQAHYFDECQRLYKRVLVEESPDGSISAPPAEKPGIIKMVPTKL